MNTGKYHPEGNAYPGVFIRGEDAVKWAAMLNLMEIKPTPEFEELMRHGVRNEIPFLIRALESVRP